MKASFVITIAGSVAQSTGCGGVASEGETSGGSGGVTISSGGSGGAGGYGANPPSPTGGYFSGGGGNPPAPTGGYVSSGGSYNPPPPIACPGDTRSVDAPVCPAAGRCTRTLTCASGEHGFMFSCEAAKGYSINEACALPYDHCFNPEPPYERADCVQGSWRLLGIGGNPPAPCPNDAPPHGKACRPGGFGGDRENCGYRCPDGQGWTIMSCVHLEAPDGGAATHVWQSDGACGDGGLPHE